MRSRTLIFDFIDTSLLFVQVTRITAIFGIGHPELNLSALVAAPSPGCRRCGLNTIVTPLAISSVGTNLLKVLPFRGTGSTAASCHPVARFSSSEDGIQVIERAKVHGVAGFQGRAADVGQ